MQFEAAYTKFYPALVGYASARLDQGLAEDLAQDAFIEAWKTWGMAKIENMRAYLIAILRRCWFQHLRKKRVETVDCEAPDLGESDPDALAKIDGERALVEIRAQGANGQCLEMMAMGWEKQQIADHLGVSRQRVQERIKVALERLAKKWGKSYGPG